MAAAKMTESLGRRSRSRSRSVATRCWEGLVRGHAFQAAAAVAFWFFLSLVPLLVLAGFLVGRVARAKGVDVLLDPLVDVAPGNTLDLVRKELERLAGASASSIAPLSLAGFFWTASSGLHNLLDVVERAGKGAPRAWWKQRALSLGCVVLLLAAVCAAAWTFVRIPSATAELPSLAPSLGAHAPDRGAANGKGGHPSSSGPRRARVAMRAEGSRGVAGAIALVLGTVLLAGFYRLAARASAWPSASRKPGRRQPVWPGTWFAVGSWLAVSWGFGAYVGSLGNYALYYGSLAAVAVTLVWLYLTSLSLVVGAHVNAALAAER